MDRILVFAPHPDDEILGVGGTMIKNIAQGNEVYVCIVTKGVEPLFRESGTEITRNEARTCHKALGIKETIFLDFPAVMIEECHRYEVNAKIQDLVERIAPTEVYLPHWGDMQKDHQIVTDYAMVALRPKYSFAPKRIYAYETMSETGWNVPNVQNEFSPNVFVDISEQLGAKLDAMRFFATQLSEFPNARSLEALEALAKYRGALMNVRAAEAFELIRELK